MRHDHAQTLAAAISTRDGWTATVEALKGHWWVRAQHTNGALCGYLTQYREVSTHLDAHLAQAQAAYRTYLRDKARYQAKQKAGTV